MYETLNQMQVISAMMIATAAQADHVELEGQDTAGEGRERRKEFALEVSQRAKGGRRDDPST